MAGRGASRCRACAGWSRATVVCGIADSTREGRTIDRSVSGFHARVVQHEVDHLDGILYPMRMTDMRNLFGFEDVLFPGSAPRRRRMD